MALTAEALAALLAVQEFSGTTEPTATLPLPRNSFRSVHAPSFPLTRAVCSPPCSPGPTSMGSQHWFCRGESSPFQQRACVLHNKLNSAQALVFHQKLSAQEGCVQSIPSRGTASYMRKGSGKQHSSRQQINAGPELVAGGWQTWTKIRPDCWTDTRNIGADELGTKEILSLQLFQGKTSCFPKGGATSNTKS